MLIKATQAIFDDSVLTTPRYPTDLWSGYGFSSSLPADLLKGMLDLSTNSSEVGRVCGKWKNGETERKIQEKNIFLDFWNFFRMRKKIFFSISWIS